MATSQGGLRSQRKHGDRTSDSQDWDETSWRGPMG